MTTLIQDTSPTVRDICMRRSLCMTQDELCANLNHQGVLVCSGRVQQLVVLLAPSQPAPARPLIMSTRVVG